ncbi:MAG TPA: prepilin-type N-terminal cleavage/methylation domain-containing protein [Gemmatimonadaceae bacterium]|jgi:prepilin-type N-terminal cleavage/methylation domain-containing protein
MRAVVRNRPGFTLWELSMVLIVLALAATLAAPAFARFGTEQPSRGADQLVGLLRDARKAAFDHNATVVLRIDPKTLKYQVDTTTPAGGGMLAEGVLELDISERIETDQLRLMYVFQPTGAAFADTVVVRGTSVPLVVRVDPFNGVARADTL